jgi:hypothetical protein
MTASEISNKIEEIINSNCIEVEYEGTYVNKSQMKIDLLQLIIDLEKKDLVDFEKSLICFM